MANCPEHARRWHECLKRWSAGGLSRATYCAWNGLSRSTWYRWEAIAGWVGSAARSRRIAKDKYDVHKVNVLMLQEMGITDKT